MKWPLVARALYEASERDLARQCGAQVTERAEAARTIATFSAAIDTLERQAKDAEGRHDREMVRAEARYAELMVSYRLLRLQGHTPPDVPRETKQAAPPDPVMQAVNRASRGDPELRARMLAQIAVDRREKPNLTDIELVSRIERGNRPAEELDS